MSFANHATMKQIVRKPINGIYHNCRSVFDLDQVKIKVMSDSICFYVDSSLQNALYALVQTCRYFQSDLLCRDSPVLVRGAVTKGLLYADDHLIFGQGFVDAYLQEETNAIYPRIIVLDSVLDVAKQSMDEDLIPVLNVFIYHDSDGRC